MALNSRRTGRNLRLVVAYDGTAYHGFQTQRPGLPTVQAMLERAVEAVSGHRSRITGAGRTDAGVHARGQVVNFFTPCAIPVARWAAALGSVLPRDIVVVRADEVSADFHARFDALAKIYRYFIYQSEVRSPFWDRYALRSRVPLDTAAMAEAAALLRGKHCFRAFHDAGSPPRDTRRTLFDLSLHQFDAEDVWSFMCPGPRAGLRGLPFLVITLVADGFLYHMARVLVGTLLEVGRGALSPQSVAERLADGRRDLAGPTAPPRGLWLDAVLYADDPRTWFYLDTVRVVQ